MHPREPPLQRLIDRQSLILARPANMCPTGNSILVTAVMLLGCITAAANVVAAAAPLLYVAGGTNDRQPDGEVTVEAFNGTGWVAVAPMKTPRNVGSAAVYAMAGKLFLFAIGQRMQEPAGEVVRFDGTEWTTAPSMGATRSHLQVYSVASKQYLYAIGGNLDTVEKFNGTAWETSGPMRHVPGGGTAVYTIQGTEYLCELGGPDATQSATSSLYLFNGTRWSLSPAHMSVNRSTHGVVVYSIQGKDRLMAVGGYDARHYAPGEVYVPLSSVEAFDGERWGALAPLQIARYDVAISVYAVAGRDHVFVIGGKGANNIALASVESFDGKKWRFVSPMAQARIAPLAAVFTSGQCVDGKFGANCTQSCSCDRVGSTSVACDATTGRCTCRPTFTGRACGLCSPGWYGSNCDQACNCSVTGTIDGSSTCTQATGNCSCSGHFAGRRCDGCEDGWWGQGTCTKECDCNGNAAVCDAVNGTCSCAHNGCKPASQPNNLIVIVAASAASGSAVLLAGLMLFVARRRGRCGGERRVGVAITPYDDQHQEALLDQEMDL